jgi:hypothetical protein
LAVRFFFVTIAVLRGISEVEKVSAVALPV